MSYETITLETDARGVATLTMNRPDKHNAMNPALLNDLAAATTALAEDPAVRVVVLTGAGKSFSAGGDLSMMQQQFTATREERMKGAREFADMLYAMNTLPKPVIGRINGQAFGGGMGLISICDVAIAVQGPKFGLTEVRLGMIPATISPYVVARMGETMARRVFFSSRLFDAEEGVTLNLFRKAVAAEDLDAAIEAAIKPYLSAAPGAVARSNRLPRMKGAPITPEIIDLTVNALADAWEDPEAHEGIGAFFEKRDPAWKVVG